MLKKKIMMYCKPSIPFCTVYGKKELIPLGFIVSYISNRHIFNADSNVKFTIYFETSS